MLRPPPSHIAFQEALREALSQEYILPGRIHVLLSNAMLIAKVWLLDLGSLPNWLRPAYAKDERGRPPRDPCTMFRSLLLMTFLHVTGIDDWVLKLSTVPLYAILSGFSPDDTPGVGTFYDFIDRLWKAEDRSVRAERRKKLRKKRKRPKKKPKAGKKLPPKHSGITERVLRRILRDQHRSHRKPDAILQGIFQQCFVMPSAQRGLLGSDPDRLVLAGDGTVFRSATSPYGQKECECRRRGLFKCDCPRRLSDPAASWGWDSHREVWVYGYSAYVLTAADSPHDLPAYLSMNACQRHDSVASLYALDHLQRANPHLGVVGFLGDSAHDAYPIYEYLDTFDIEAVIDLNSRSEGKTRYPGPLSLTPEGVPICGCGFPMVHWGYCPGRRRIKWRCPVACGRRPEGAPEVCTCSPSPYGRTIYTKPKDDLRHFTRTPRGSDEWKVKLAKRSSAERTMKSVKETYDIKRCRHRTRHVWHTRLFLAAMAQHVDAWVRTSHLDMHAVIHSWAQPGAIAA